VCKTRLVYRIERREDGQGPYPSFHKGNGYSSATIRRDYIFGCHSMDALKPWLSDLRSWPWFQEVGERDYVVRVYRVPLKHVYDKPRRNDRTQHNDPRAPWYDASVLSRYDVGCVTCFELMFNRDKSQCLATLPLPAAA
jgi:hypothetical protein